MAEGKQGEAAEKKHRASASSGRICLRNKKKINNIAAIYFWARYTLYTCLIPCKGHFQVVGETEEGKRK